MARQEPFRALFEEAKKTIAEAEVPVPTRALVSPAPVLDEEHKRPTLEQRLDAAILAAGATPPLGLRAPKQLAKELVPLRLERESTPPMLVTEERAPSPRMLAFLRDENNLSALTDDSVSAIPRLEPVHDSGSLRAQLAVSPAESVSTNVYRLSRLLDDDTPSRPLPVLALRDVDLDDVDTEVVPRARRHVDKVVLRSTLGKIGDSLGISLRAFSLNTSDSGEPTSFDVDVEDTRPRATAAVALAALSEEGLPELDDDNIISDVGGEDLDELARQLGLEGLVPRAMPVRADDSLEALPSLPELGPELEDLDEVSADDVELVAVLNPTDPMRAIVKVRPLHESPAPIVLDDDDDATGFVVQQQTPPSGTRKLPPSLLEGTPLGAVAKARAAFAENEVTPALHSGEQSRPSLQAPQAVRFVVAEPVVQHSMRPRPDLSPKERAKNKSRAHDLYLIALDDVAYQDLLGAIAHLELALAYDDDEPLYHDLKTQLQRQLKRGPELPN